MSIPRLALGIALLAGCLFPSGRSGAAYGQGGSRVEDPVYASPGWAPVQSPSPDRTLRRTRAIEAAAVPTQSVPQTSRAWVSPRRPTGVAIARATAAETPIGPNGDQPETIPTPVPLESKPAPKPSPSQPFSPPWLSQPGMREMQPGEMGFEPGAGIGMTEPFGSGCGGCESGCDSCGGGCDDSCGDDECDCGLHRLGIERLLGNMSLFVGVQGFKGPVDLGQNGNFGFHEGLNFGGPLGDPWCSGFQLGFQGVESNFAGSQADGGSAHGREQAFFTAGLFHRATCGGLQGGFAFDYLHDSYYVKADLKQIRSETSYVFDGGHEIGYWGAYGISKQRFQLLTETTPTLFQPNDIFAAFYRKHFAGGVGEARVWAGATGGGEGIVGADFSIPLGTSLAIENSFTYLIPKHGPNGGGQLEEGWSLAMQLVWYPGRPAHAALQDPYRPLFGVGDNSTFMVRR
jgi:hypothetical protein